MKQINSLQINRLLVAPHYRFHEETLSGITLAGADVLHIEDFLKDYSDNVNKEYKFVSTLHNLPNTAKIAEFDNYRDASLRHLFRSVKRLMKHPESTLRDAGNNIWSVISTYDGVENYELFKQTTLVQSLIDEILASDISTVIDKHVGSNTLQDISGFNNVININLQDRVDKLNEREKVDLHALRNRSDELYANIRLYINAFAIAVPDERIDAFIDKQNTLIGTYRSVITHMRRGGSGNESLPKKEDEEA